MRQELGLLRLVSGGQTGVDQAALDAAIELGIPHGGWCPAGRKAENGQIPSRFQLMETTSSHYPIRTEKNVVDSDATLILFRRKLTGGTLLTADLARRDGRPLMAIDLLELATDSESNSNSAESRKMAEFFRWLEANGVRVLNVAGPRESSCPGIGQCAKAFLLTAAAIQS
jgi:hypothetical protein